MAAENGTSPKFVGVKVTLAGKQYTVPSLNFRKLQEHSTLISELQPMKVKDLYDLGFSASKYIPILHAALSRNYPEVSLDDLLDTMQVEDREQYITGLLAAFGVDLMKTQEPTVGEASAVAS